MRASISSALLAAFICNGFIPPTVVTGKRVQSNQDQANELAPRLPPRARASETAVAPTSSVSEVAQLPTEVAQAPVTEEAFKSEIMFENAEEAKGRYRTEGRFVGLPGCRVARIVVKGRRTAPEAGGVWVDILIWECVRCERGYLEKWTVADLPSKIANNPAFSTRQLSRQTCVWKPCGDVCEKCALQLSHGPRPKSAYICHKCQELPYVTRVRAATSFSASRDGQQVVIEQVCLAKDPFRSPPPKLSAKDALIPILDSLKQITASDELVPLSLLQQAAVFVRVVTAEFLATSKKGEENSLDMVQDGTRFMDAIVRDAVASLTASETQLVGKKLEESQVLADARGALGLCAQIAFQKMGDNFGEGDDSLARSQKHCDSVDNVFHRLILAVGANTSLGKSGATDFASLDEAPQRASDILTMFGLMVGAAPVRL